MKVVLLIVAMLSCVGYCQLAGGWTAAEINSPDVVQLSNDATSSIASSNGGLCEKAYVLKQVTTQVVAGINYKLVYEIHPENCALSSDSNARISPGSTCTVKFWVKKWQNFQKITSNDCVGTVAADPSTTPKKSFIGRGDHDIGHMGMFKKFVHKYSKMYNDEKEFNIRFRIFRKNMKKVKLLQQTEQGTAVYGATEFADLTEEEFRQYHLGLKPRFDTKMRAERAMIPDIEIPDEYDWRSYNVVTSVKNQGMCGSCWAFSVTGNVEGQWAIQRKELLSLSEQELVDCDKVDQGCNGGFMTDAYGQIIKLGGLETETDYPYEGVDDSCQFSKPKAKVTISGYVNISQDENDMAKWLAQNGPISIGINANAMQFYFGGVSHPFRFLCNADLDSIDHGVLIVGYGVTTSSLLKKTLPYWIVKNSWGEYWGEQGYYRVYRGDGTCGVNLMASSATV